MDDPTKSSNDAQDPTTAPFQKRKNGFSVLKEFYTSPETRINALLLTAVLTAMVGFGAYRLWGGATPRAALSNPGNGTQQVKNLPGGNQGGILYNQALAKLNAKRAAQAQQQGKTFLPTTGPMINAAAKTRSAAPKPAPSPAPAPAPAPAPVPSPQNTAAQKDVQMELMRLLDNPNPAPLTTSFRVKNTAPNNAASGTQSPGSKMSVPALALAGHISFGELLTSLNSNEPGPVEAEIVSGRFKGAKILGGFKREHDRVVVKFSQMTWNHQTVPISAYAINAKTARTYVATSVNHHDLYRWGSLIAASFLGGLTNALQMANSSTTMGNGFAVVTNRLTNAEIPMAAAGNVGNVLTPIMTKQFYTPPTVREAQGAPIGVLFMKVVK